MKEIILKYALQNAVKYNGKANLNSVIGKVFSELKEINKEQLINEAKIIINEVNSLSIEQQKENLNKLAPELLE